VAKSVPTAAMTNYAQNVEYVGIASAEKETSAITAVSAKCALITSVSAEKDVPTVQQFVWNAVRNVRIAPIPSCALNAANASIVPVRTASAQRADSARTAE